MLVVDDLFSRDPQHTAEPVRFEIAALYELVDLGARETQVIFYVGNGEVFASTVRKCVCWATLDHKRILASLRCRVQQNIAKNQRGEYHVFMPTASKRRAMRNREVAQQEDKKSPELNEFGSYVFTLMLSVATERLRN